MSGTGYGYRLNDGREILVHVVAADGWREAYGGGWTALAMCGAGLDREAGWPGEGQKWCRRCTDSTYRYLGEARVWPVGSFEQRGPSGVAA
ncbi:hypothetical protein ACWD2L_00625 [Streptomyces sp. NPDC002754]